ncbi:hypothetical protein VOI54_12755 [Tamlana sp. 2201CG12-4]|uniref:hypothetical protein n=1 Tax=Tamlana sp. 2201CG12-4 TaxID=3112582 RepID=UPI002DB85CF7|nr:hypothetical protein [Tamlana sp. 2201CG12-4]MEC3907892.1 hypothetical protein [Tamlana sp. 2201CG12-4]
MKLKSVLALSLISLFFLITNCSNEESLEDLNDKETIDDNDNNNDDSDIEPFTITMHESKNSIHMVLPDNLSVDDPNEFDDDARFDITEKLYETFKDEFDWVILVTNTEENPGFSYSGISTNGYFGFASKLNGIIHLTHKRSVKHGPTMHELGHRWTPHKGLYLYSSAANAPGLHPDSDGRDPLGGGNGEKLKEVTVEAYDSETSTTVATTLGDGGIFETDKFGRVANGGNTIPYNGQSMFEMGFISWDQAGYVWMPTNAEHLYSEYTPSTGEGFTRFSADKIEKMSIKDFEINVRGITEDNPVNNTQSFKILVVLLDNKKPVKADFDLFNEHVEWLTLAGDDGDDEFFNFWEATNQLGTLISGPLDAALK